MDELISRQAAIDALRTCYDTETITMDNGDEYINYGDAVGEIEQLPPAQPDIIYCKDCSKRNKRIGDYVENSDGTYYWIWKGQACPLAEFRGVAQGHEFDYQFCVYGERRTE